MKDQCERTMILRLCGHMAEEGGHVESMSCAWEEVIAWFAEAWAWHNPEPLTYLQGRC